MPTLTHDPLSHLDVLRKAAARFSCPGMEAEDLEQEGYPGLAEACESFDEARGIPFERWAIICARGAIINAIRSRGGSLIHVPGRQAKALLNDPPAELTTDQRQRREAAARVVSGRMTTDCSIEDGSLGDLVADHRRSFDPTVFRLDVLPRLGDLPELDREIVGRFFGLDDHDEQEPEAIGRSLGMSTVSVMDSLEGSLATLRQSLGYVPELRHHDLHQEHTPMSRLNGFLNPSANGIAAPTIEADPGRCPKCSRRFKTPTSKVCYNQTCENFRVGTTRRRQTRKPKDTPEPKVDRKPTKATRAKRATPTRKAKPAPALPPRTPTVDPLAGLAMANELAVMSAIANLPRAAAERVCAWAMSHVGG